MPLLDRKEHPPGAKVAPKNADEVFVIRCTGEVVRTYEEYIHKRNLYALHKWQDKYYGRTGLTYEEALRFEEQAENQIKEQVAERGLLEGPTAVGFDPGLQNDHLFLAHCCSSLRSWKRTLSGRYITAD